MLHVSNIYAIQIISTLVAYKTFHTKICNLLYTPCIHNTYVYTVLGGVICVREKNGNSASCVNVFNTQFQNFTFSFWRRASEKVDYYPKQKIIMGAWNLKLLEFRMFCPYRVFWQLEATTAMISSWNLSSSWISQARTGMPDKIKKTRQKSTTLKK